MKWRKRGKVFEPTGQFPWMEKYGILPTPIYIQRLNIIRIFFATSAADNIGRITFLDVNADNPTEVLRAPDKIVLKEGENGLFDDCGVNPSSIVELNDYVMLYYVGYQRSYKVPFTLFPGVATGSIDGAFKRVQKVPVIDRSDKYPYSMAAPFVLNEGGKFKMWLWIAKNWTEIHSKAYLSAKIGYAESENGIDWSIIKDDCIDIDPKTEFSVGRPYITKEGDFYKMFYSIRYIDRLYRLGYAESNDGLNWARKDDEVGIDVSESGWDSEMICYPAVIKVKNKTYMFYNGNNNGTGGFGVAELE